MAGSANSIQTHNVLRGKLSEDNVIAGTVGTGYNPTYALVGEAAAQIVLYINSSDYKMYAELKDKNGNHIMNSNIIDLPLETMVVNGSYDSETREVVLILDNGNELRFSVADLVRGLVSEEDLATTLGDYVKFTDYATDSASGVLKTNFSNSFSVNPLNGVPYCDGKTYEQYGSAGNGMFIGKQTLENVITGKQLVNKTYVDEADDVFEEDLFGDALINDSGENITLENTIEEGLLRINLKGNTSQEVIQGEVGLEEEDTSIYVDDVNEDKENYITLKGNTYQDGEPTPDTPQEIEVVTGLNEVRVEGKNLLNTSANNTTLNVYFDGTNGLITNDVTKKNCIFNEYILVKPNTTYTISSKEITSGSIYSYVEYDSGKNFIRYISSGNGRSDRNYTFTTGSTTSYIRIRYKYDDVSDITNEIIESKELQLEVGSTATPYEAYKGATYEVNLGKNLLNYDNNTNVENRYIDNSGNYVSDGNKYYINEKINVNSNTPYTISCGDKIGGNANLRIAQYKNDGTFISRVVAITQNKKYTITTNENCSYVIISVEKTSSEKFVNLQFEKGSEATLYSNYFTPIELCKIGTYQDRIYKSNGNWYLHKEVDKMALNGSENWDSYTNATTNLLTFRLAVASIKSYKQRFILCNYYTNVVETDTYNGQIQNRYNNFYNLEVVDTSKTLATFKTWLSNNNVNVYYVLNTPTDTQITDTTLLNQLNALYNATIYSTTHINTETSNLLPYINLKYNVVTASPSPDRASDVEVVKGNNTITISNEDGTKTQTFNVNLGNLELCKIGDYQDYIYYDKSADKWYKYGMIGKFQMNNIASLFGNLTQFQSNFNATNGILGLRLSKSNFTNLNIEQINFGNCFCNRFTARNGGWNDVTSLHYFSCVDGLIIWITYDEIGLSKWTPEAINDLETRLTTYFGDTIFYLPLADPVSIEITDQLLVSQLDELQKAMSYYDKTIITQTNADKPFILDVTTFKNTTKGKIEVIEEKNQSFENKNNKVIIINSSSTDTQYPSAKCVYDLVGNVESILEILDVGSGV